MSQKVRIDGVKHAGASVFLGVDHCGNPCWTRNPERVMVWLCDGWRTRFNQRREQRTRSIPVKNEAGDIIDWVKEPLGGPDVSELLSDREARLQCSWIAAVPSSILASTDRIEGTEWFAGLKRKKTAGGRVPGFKSRHRGLGFVCWYRPSNHSYNAVFHRTGRKSGVVVITGMNPSRWRKLGKSSIGASSSMCARVSRYGPIPASMWTGPIGRSCSSTCPCRYFEQVPAKLASTVAACIRWLCPTGPSWTCRSRRRPS